MIFDDTNDMYEYDLTKEKLLMKIFSDGYQKINNTQERTMAGNRYMAVGWMLEVVSSYKYNSVVSHLAVQLFDRFLMVQKVRNNSLQLVATACMSIAFKYHSEHAPQLKDLVYRANDCFTLRLLLDTEIILLNTLEHELYYPTIHSFIELFPSKIDSINHIRSRLSDIVLMDVKYMTFHQSELANAILFLSQCIYDGVSWTTNENVNKSCYDFISARLNDQSCFISSVMNDVELKSKCYSMYDYWDQNMERGTKILYERLKNSF
jgi:Cyclin, N-terminal domain/Cyclin, C-terminal domain